MTRTARSWPFVHAGIVAGIALATCVSGIFNDFAQDDIPLIGDDQRVHSLAHLGTILHTAYWPAPYAAELYRPATTALLAFEYALGGGSPAVFRLASYLLYAVACVAVLLLARRLLPPKVALAAAALFAAHPIHTEAVALAANQSELVVALLCVVAMLRYLRAREGEAGEAGGIVSWREWGILATIYAVACLTKENGFVLPALLAIGELTLVSGVDAPPPRARWRGFALLAVVGAVLFAVRASILGGVAGSFTAEALQGKSEGVRLLTVLQVVPAIGRLLVWPAHLQLDYSPGEIVASTGFGLAEAVGLVILLGAIGGAVLLRRRRPTIAFGLAWCVTAWLPVSNLIIPSGIVLAERTLFLPSVGFILALGGAIEVLLARATIARHAGAFAAIGAMLVAAGVGRSIARERDWRNNWELWYRTAQQAPRSFRAQRVFAEILVKIGKMDLARDAYARAIAAAPEPWKIRNELAAQLLDSGDDAGALEQAEASLRERPDQPTAVAEAVVALIALGRYDDAIRTADAPAVRADSVIVGLRVVADSARKAHAPPGAVRLRLKTAPASVQAS